MFLTCVLFLRSTSLLLTSTRWVCSTIKLSSVHSLSSGQSINLGNIEFFISKNWESRESNPGPLSEKQEHFPLCNAVPCLVFFITFICIPSFGMYCFSLFKDSLFRKFFELFGHVRTFRTFSLRTFLICRIYVFCLKKLTKFWRFWPRHHFSLY